MRWAVSEPDAPTCGKSSPRWIRYSALGLGHVERRGPQVAVIGDAAAPRRAGAAGRAAPRASRSHPPRRWDRHWPPPPRAGGDRPAPPARRSGTGGAGRTKSGMRLQPERSTAASGSARKERRMVTLPGAGCGWAAALGLASVMKLRLHAEQAQHHQEEDRHEEQHEDRAADHTAHHADADGIASARARRPWTAPAAARRRRRPARSSGSVATSAGPRRARNPAGCCRARTPPSRIPR